MKHATSVRLDQPTLAKLEQLKVRYGLTSTTDVITKLIHDASSVDKVLCDNKVLGVGDKVPAKVQSGRRLTEQREGVLTYVYPEHHVVARVTSRGMVVVNVFHAEVWYVAMQYWQFQETPVRVLEQVEYWQRNPDNFEGWSKERRVAEGYPVKGMV